MATNKFAVSYFVATNNGNGFQLGNNVITTRQEQDSLTSDQFSQAISEIGQQHNSSGVTILSILPLQSENTIDVIRMI